MAEIKHSKIGASSAHRWFNCPASVQMSEGIEQETSVYAQEGTEAHDFAEKCLLEGLDPMECFGQYGIREEMAEAVKVYTDEVDRILGEEGESAELLVEHTFHLEEIDKELFGTADAVIYVPFKKLYVLDYKHGMGVPVVAEENKQQLYYALGAYAEAEVDEVELVIVQPRCNKPGHEKVNRWKTTPQRLEEFRKELITAVERTREDNPHIEAGSWCKFCPAAKTCPELAKHALEECHQDFKDVVVRAERAEPPAPESLTPLQLSRLMDSFSIIEDWMKEVKKHIQNEMENGVTVPYYKLVKKRSNRKWKDENEVIEEFEDLMGDEIYDKKLKTPAKLEKVLGKDAVSDKVYYPDAGVTVAHETDKRPEVQNRASLDFEDL
jgi:hypothetical protein